MIGLDWIEREESVERSDVYRTPQPWPAGGTYEGPQRSGDDILVGYWNVTRETGRMFGAHPDHGTVEHSSEGTTTRVDRLISRTWIRA